MTESEIFVVPYHPYAALSFCMLPSSILKMWESLLELWKTP